MRSDDLLLGLALVHQLLYTVVNSGEHFVIGFDVRSVHEIAIHRDDSNFGTGPTAQRFKNAFQIPSMGYVNSRVAVTGEIFSEVQQVGHVEMHEDLGVVAATA